MSALSIPPSQTRNVSVGLESIHNYANVPNPVAFVGNDQYRVVAVYTEVEASEVHEEIMESDEVQDQTDFYKEEIVAASVDNVGHKEANSLMTEEKSETVDVAKALETLTKTFALRKETLSQDVLTGKNNDLCLNDELGSENAPDEGKIHEGHKTSDQTEENIENTVEEVQEDFLPADKESNLNFCVDPTNNHEPLSVHDDMADVSGEDPVSETQQSPCSANVRRSTRLQMKTPHSWREACKTTRPSSEINEEPKTYKNHLHCNNSNVSSFEMLSVYSCSVSVALFVVTRCVSFSIKRFL